MNDQTTNCIVSGINVSHLCLMQLQLLLLQDGLRFSMLLANFVKQILCKELGTSDLLFVGSANMAKKNQSLRVSGTVRKRT